VGDSDTATPGRIQHPLVVTADLRGNRDAILYGHRTILAVFAAALLAGLVCAALLPGRGLRRAPSELPASTPAPTPDGPKKS
jgi:hypothetical protein